MRRALLLALVSATLPACVQFNAECSPPVDEPDYVVTWLAEPIPVSKTVVRTQENALGDAITDAYVAALQTSDRPPEVAIDNSGDMRDQGLCVTRTDLGKGPLERKVLKQVIAFSDELFTVELTYRELFDVLEHGVATLAIPGVNAGGQFLQVSGLGYEVDCSKPAEQLSISDDGKAVRDEEGQRVVSITLGGKTILRSDPDVDTKTVVVAMSSFLAGGGDNFVDLDPANLPPQRQPVAASPERFTYNVVESYLHGLQATKQAPADLKVDPANPRIVLRNCE